MNHKKAQSEDKTKSGKSDMHKMRREQNELEIIKKVPNIIKELKRKTTKLKHQQRALLSDLIKQKKEYVNLKTGLFILSSQRIRKKKMQKRMPKLEKQRAAILHNQSWHIENFITKEQFFS